MRKREPAFLSFGCLGSLCLKMLCKVNSVFFLHHSSVEEWMHYNILKRRSHSRSMIPALLHQNDIFIILSRDIGRNGWTKVWKSKEWEVSRHNHWWSYFLSLLRWARAKGPCPCMASCDVAIPTLRSQNYTDVSHLVLELSMGMGYLYTSTFSL